MKIIDGTSSPLGRIASYAAKEALKGEEIIILNCEKIIITGNAQFVKEKFLRARRRVGTLQVGPKHSRLVEKIVKRSVRGMLPKHKWGRGKESLQKIKCYRGIPKDFLEKPIIRLKEKIKKKHVTIQEIAKDE